MKESCVLKPTAKNGEISKLYTDLYNLTAKDRKLTNLLYAISLQDAFQGKFQPSDFNSQGELKTDIVMKALDVEKIISDKANLQKEAKSIGAIDSDGDVEYFDTVNEILDRVVEYNSSHATYKAIIKHGEEGFYIEVETLNAENYNINNSLRIREATYNALISLLQKQGLNTRFSKDVQGTFNVLNVYNTISRLRALRTNLENLNPSNTKMICELFADNSLLQRIKEHFGKDTATAISKVTGYNFQLDADVDVDDYWSEKIYTFLTEAVQPKFKHITNTTWDALLTNAKAGITTDETYMHTDGMSIRETLKELYNLYHIDQERVNAINARVSKISEAANQTLQINIALLKEQEMKTGKDKKTEAAFKRIQAQIEDGNYIVSIIDMLANITRQLQASQARIKLLKKKMDKNPNSPEAASAVAQLVLKHIEYAEAYKDILKTLQNANLLENDDSISNNDLIEALKSTAGELALVLNQLEDDARRKQYDIVYSFMKIYWGEDTAEAQKQRGSTTTLEDIMKLATSDINFFDRFLYAVGDTNDEMMNLIGQAVKQAHYRRDAILRDELFEIRKITDELYKSGSSTTFMFEMDEKGYPKRIISNYDYEKFDREFEKYKAQIKADETIDKRNWSTLEEEWVSTHMKNVEEFGLKFKVPIYEKADSQKLEKILTPEQYTYYRAIMAKKAKFISQIQAVPNESLFDVIELSNDFTTAVADSNGNPAKVYGIIKNKVVDLFKTREDDTEYGNMIMDANGVIIDHVSATGETINQLPIFYTHKIKDRSRVSTDFSRSMMAFAATSIQYTEMNKIIDALLLAKDYMLQRNVQQTLGNNIVGGAISLGKKNYFNIATKKGEASRLSGLADDYFERVVYGKKRKASYLWGTRIDKAVDVLTGYTSVTGLTVNFFGAEVNAIVGKLQMLIESGLGMGGEFFGMKDLGYADVKYWQLLGDVLLECESNNKSSLLGLLMDEYDVTDDFYEKVKESGFYKSPLSKIIGNTNLFMLYGLGEHLIHAQTMIAVLHNTKVVDEQGNETHLMDAYTVEKDGKNARLVIKPGYKFVDSKGNKTDITPEAIDKLRRRIAYCNRSMHGAFGDDEKGMIHRYAFGRLLMNFRQWMPAHYSRRFRGTHYNADLGEYREGYYYTAWKFVAGCAKDLFQRRFQIATRWAELSDMERYNLKRTTAETMLLVGISASLALLGSEKDHKGNWAMRHLIYLLKRLNMETKASSPFNLGFFDNIMTMLNSPMACLNTIKRLRDIVDVTDMFETIENGKYKGENRYVHNLEKNAPFVGQIIKQYRLGEDEDLFNVFPD